MPNPELVEFHRKFENPPLNWLVYTGRIESEDLPPLQEVVDVAANWFEAQGVPCIHIRFLSDEAELSELRKENEVTPPEELQTQYPEVENLFQQGSRTLAVCEADHIAMAASGMISSLSPDDLMAVWNAYGGNAHAADYHSALLRLGAITFFIQINHKASPDTFKSGELLTTFFDDFYLQQCVAQGLPDYFLATRHLKRSNQGQMLKPDRITELLQHWWIKTVTSNTQPDETK